MNAARSGRGSPARAVLLLAAALFAGAAVFPEAALQPIASLVAQMRQPAWAVPAARAFFITTALLVFGAAVFWRTLAGATACAIDAIAACSPSAYAWLVTCIAVATRALDASALSYVPSTDADWYHLVAASLARGEGFAIAGEPTAFRSPGYALLLAALYRLGGIHIHWAWLIGSVATAMLMAAVYFVAERLHGVVVARVATLGAAVYPALVLMTGQALSDLPFVAGLYALLALLLRADASRMRVALVAGIFVGVLTLFRTVGLGLLALVPAIGLLRTRNASALLQATVVATIACAAVVLPWMVRNELVLGRFTLGTNSGSNLYVGNRADATGWRDRFAFPDAVMRARNEVERDDALVAEAIAAVRNDPGATIARLPSKLLGMYLLETEAVTSHLQGQAQPPAAVKLMLYGTSQLCWFALALAVVARITTWRNAADRPRGVQWSGWLLAGYFTAVCLLFFGSDRYRLPILPWLLIEAAAALVRAITAVKRAEGARSSH